MGMDVIRELGGVLISKERVEFGQKTKGENHEESDDLCKIEDKDFRSVFNDQK